ncbi:hypothetical protein [Polyangium fumosum]|uniref:DUF3352 domain-containing protein n=1 Tax=Polyangium fumosum TaxID=889272 RepID=A0A4U1IHN7_9BACT|nr:hypothetical protein [Polyangium fumosum]TKC93322.1 hypothetical protein E8A74_49835 [Polyangium fumosum]
MTRFARGLLFAVALALPVTLAGCKGEQPPPPQKVAPLEPIPAPAGHLADVFVPNPDEAWAKARAAVGGPALFLPSNASNLAVTFLGLPLAVSAEIDGNLPLVGALVERPGGGRPRTAMGIHVRDAGKVEGLLVKGENARFQIRVDEKTSITLLEPKDGGARAVAIGLLGNYLLFAQDVADLLEVGPYVVRTLPTAKMPKADVAFELPREALGGPIEKGLRSSWESLRPRPRPSTPTADGAKAPTPVPSPLNGLMDALLGILVELDHARVTLDFDDHAAHLRLLGTPREGSTGAANIAAMSVGDPRRLLELPADTDIAIYLQDSASSRTADAKKYADALAGAIGKDIPEDDRAALSAALVALAEGRGDSFTAGASLLSTGPAIYARSDVADEGKLDAALNNLLGLAKRKSFATWLGQNEMEVSTGKTVLENLPGDIRRIRLTRAPGKDDKGKNDEKANKDRKDKPGKDGDKPAASLEGVPNHIDVLYTLGKDGLVLAAGYDAKASFRAILDAPGKENLTGRAEAKTAVVAVGDKTAFVAFVDPLRLLNRRAGKADLGPSAPVVFALGKGGEGVGANDPWMRLDIANLAIQELVKRRGAL